ncbi:MAG: 5-formyltetrahydrofolate cyclo-ligase [Selenomonadaceae bacterium]|nr:5-formyltetrahydrofolate cyclo-ligase [Selenomonadaceae bacterium]
MSDDIQSQKKILRREFLTRRANVSRNERDRVSRELVRKFLATELYRESKILMAYASRPDELQLTELFNACFVDGKILAIPLIVSKGEMSAVEVPNFDALELGAFNIFTVKPELRKFVDAEKIDCVIVPGAAFDIHGGRLGLGGGYYDRFLLHAVKAHKIAFAYDFQLVDNLPKEFHDVKIDSVMTPKIFWHAVDDQKFRHIATP